MNFDMFQGYFRAFRLDEVKIIGKDVTLDGECLHVVGIGRKKDEPLSRPMPASPSASLR